MARNPTQEEKRLARHFLARQGKSLKTEGRSPDNLALPLPDGYKHDLFASAALVDLCLALLNSNEFLYVD